MFLIRSYSLDKSVKIFETKHKFDFSSFEQK